MRNESEQYSFNSWNSVICVIFLLIFSLGKLTATWYTVMLGAVFGVVTMIFAILQVKAVKLRQVEGMANFLVKNFGFFFVPAAVSLMLYLDIICAQWVPILVASAVSTVVVMVVTGWIHQLARKFF